MFLSVYPDPYSAFLGTETTWTYLSPAAGAAAVAVLDEQMRRADLALGDTRDGLVPGAGAVVSGHVVLELLAVGSCGRLPSRDLLGHVEVVGELLGLGVSNFPVGRESGISL